MFKLLLVTSGPKLISHAYRDLRYKASPSMMGRRGKGAKRSNAAPDNSWHRQWSGYQWSNGQWSNGHWSNGQWWDAEQWGNNEWSDDQWGVRPNKKPKGTYFTKEEHFAGACSGVTLDIDKAALTCHLCEQRFIFPVAWLI